MLPLIYFFQILGLGQSNRSNGGFDYQLLGALEEGSPGVEPAVVPLFPAVLGQRKGTGGDQEELIYDQGGVCIFSSTSFPLVNIILLHYHNEDNYVGLNYKLQLLINR